MKLIIIVFHVHFIQFSFFFCFALANCVLNSLYLCFVRVDDDDDDEEYDDDDEQSKNEQQITE